MLFLSDATIRRWCGPQWRIATSRRTRDVAVVAEIQASQLDRLVAGKVEPGPLYTDLPMGEKAELTLTPQGVSCSTVGCLAFMTPIAEMNIERVTQAEADAYRQWRERYQQNWRWAFDPIALRIGVHPQQLSADLTIMPLIWGTEYRQLISISQGATIAADAGDPHNALVHAILAVNTKSEMLQRQSNFARMMAGGLQVDPLGWLGQSVCVYMDDGPFWDELAKVRAGPAREVHGRAGVADAAGRACGGFQRTEVDCVLSRGARVHRAGGARHAELGIAHVQRPALRQDHADRTGRLARRRRFGTWRSITALRGSRSWCRSTKTC